VAVEDLLHPGDRASAVEARYRKDADNLRREKAVLMEDIQVRDILHGVVCPYIAL
jgi:hypothetical protein